MTLNRHLAMAPSRLQQFIASVGQSFERAAQQGELPVMITSPSFRKLGSDIILLSRDILADAAEMTAESASEAAKATRPSEQEREQGLDYDKIKDKIIAKQKS